MLPLSVFKSTSCRTLSGVCALTLDERMMVKSSVKNVRMMDKKYSLTPNPSPKERGEITSECNESKALIYNNFLYMAQKTSQE